MTHLKDGDEKFSIVASLVTKFFSSLIIMGGSQIQPKIFLYSLRRTCQDGCQHNVRHKMGASHWFWQPWLEDHVGEKALSSNLLLKLGLAKKTFLASFPGCLLKSAWIKSTFPYALLPHHEGAKQKIIRVTRRTSANCHIIGVLCQFI